jgi:hypothetical protein
MESALSRDGSARNAAAVPLSAQCWSSRQARASGPERGALEQGLKVLQQPIALLGKRVQISQGAPVEERRVPTEKRFHQRSQLHDAFAWLGCAGADPERHALSDPRALFEQAALAHSGAALDQEDHTNPGAKPIELATEGGQFGISTAGDQPAECRLLHEASLCRYLRPDVSASE